MLRGFLKLVAVLAVSGVAGLGLGIGFSKVSGGAGLPPPVVSAAAPVAKPAPTTATATRTASAGAYGSPSPRAALEKVRVHVVSALLESAATPAGQRLGRGRLTVRIVAQNGGKLPVTAASPVLLVGGARIVVNPRATGMQLGTLAARATSHVALEFELYGAATAQLQTQHSARLFIADRSLAVAVSVGGPVSLSPATG